METSHYPVRVDGELDPQLSRGLWLVKWFLAIPHYIVLLFLWLAVWVLTVIAFFAILFTARYPRSLFDFNVGVMRWSWRVTYYSSSVLGTDRYPPFSLADDPSYPARLEIDYPERLSRGLVLVKWWLLAIPQYVVVGILMGGSQNVYDPSGDDFHYWWNPGLIGVLVVVAAVVLLFTGRYPRSLYDLVMGLNRWVIRVGAYAGLMRDEYPPFRLDQGGTDPGTAALAAAPIAPGQPLPATRAVPETGPAAPGHWTAGRIISMIVGCLLLVMALGAGLAGAGVKFADTVLRDESGFLMSPHRSLSTGTYALLSDDLEVDSDLDASDLPQRLIGDATVEVTGTGDQPVFVGVGRTAEVEAFLGDTQRATVVGFDRRPTYRTTGNTAPPTLPSDAGAADIWVARSEGTGTQTVSWPVQSGDWTVLVMNADGSRGVNADVVVGAEVPVLGWLATTLLVCALVALVPAVLFIVLALLPRRVTDD